MHFVSQARADANVTKMDKNLNTALHLAYMNKNVCLFADRICEFHVWNLHMEIFLVQTYERITSWPHKYTRQLQLECAVELICNGGDIARHNFDNHTVS